MENALKYKVKQSKNGSAKRPSTAMSEEKRLPFAGYKTGKFTSNYKASPIDFVTQISLRR